MRRVLVLVGLLGCTSSGGGGGGGDADVDVDADGDMDAPSGDLADYCDRLVSCTQPTLEGADFDAAVDGCISASEGAISPDCIDCRMPLPCEEFSTGCDAVCGG